MTVLASRALAVRRIVATRVRGRHLVRVLTVVAGTARSDDLLLGTGTVVGVARTADEVSLHLVDVDGRELEPVTYPSGARIVIARRRRP